MLGSRLLKFSEINLCLQSHLFFFFFSVFAFVFVYQFVALMRASARAGGAVGYRLDVKTRLIPMCTCVRAYVHTHICMYMHTCACTFRFANLFRYAFSSTQLNAKFNSVLKSNSLSSQVTILSSSSLSSNGILNGICAAAF